MVRSQALCTRAATSGWPMCTSIMTAPSSSPDGLARFWPARRGAEPWMASNMAHCSPVLAEPARPTEPADQFQALRDVVGLAVLDAGVEVFFVLADDHHVHAGMPGVDERVVGDARPHIGVQAQHLTGGHIQALEASPLRRGDGGLEKDSGAAQRFPRAGLDTGGVSTPVHFLADLDGFGVDAGAGRLEDAPGRLHALRADAGL